MSLPDDFWDEPCPAAKDAPNFVVDLPAGVNLVAGIPITLNGKEVGVVTSWEPSSDGKVAVMCSVFSPETIQAIQAPLQSFSAGSMMVTNIVKYPALDALLAQAQPVERRPPGQEGEATSSEEPVR